MLDTMCYKEVLPLLLEGLDQVAKDGLDQNMWSKLVGISLCCLRRRVCSGKASSPKSVFGTIA